MGDATPSAFRPWPPHKAVLELLSRCGGPAGLRKAGRRKLLSIAGPHAPRLADRLLEQIMAALDEQTVIVPGTQAAETILPRLADSLRDVLRQRDQVAGEVERMLDAHPLLTSMPGIGVRTAARIEHGLGRVSTCWDTRGPTRAYTGLLPTDALDIPHMFRILYRHVRGSTGLARAAMLLAVNDELIPVHVERALRYLALLNSEGTEPTVRQLDAFAVNPVPVRTAAELWGVSGRLFRDQPLAVSGYMQTLGWLKVGEGDRVSLTQLGFSVADALASPGARGSTIGPDTTILDLADTVLAPDDPETFERFTRAVSEAGEAMLADPYFKANTISWVLTSTKISRILMSEKGAASRGERGIVAARLASPDVGDRIEVRVTSSPEFHDRALLATRGDVWLLGTSLNGVGRHLSALVRPDREFWPLYRGRLEKLWETATVINPQPIVDSAAAVPLQPDVQQPAQRSQQEPDGASNEHR